MIRRKCKNCNKEFNTYPSRIKKGRGLFCSKKCHYKVYIPPQKCIDNLIRMNKAKKRDPKKWLIVKCAYCGKKIEKSLWRIRQYGKVYCNNQCQYQSMEKLPISSPGLSGSHPIMRHLHAWVARRKPKPKLCEDCKKNPPRDLANISQEYKSDLDDWEWICRRCHMKKDGRMKNLNFNKLL